jgi:hypothetical protein
MPSSHGKDDTVQSSSPSSLSINGRVLGPFDGADEPSVATFFDGDHLVAFGQERARYVVRGWRVVDEDLEA